MDKQQILLRLEDNYVQWLDELCLFESELLTQVSNTPIKMNRNSLIKGLIKTKYNDVFDGDETEEGE